MASSTTIRLNVAAALLKLEAQLRELPGISKTAHDMNAIHDIQNARINLTNETGRS